MKTLPAATPTPEMTALEAQAQRIETPCGNGTLVWRCWGEGPPLLLLHGGSGSWAHWIRNIPALVEAGRRVIAPDLPGFGESAEPPDGGDADAIVPPLLAGLPRVVEGPFDLVGFSFGSLVAALATAEQPWLVNRLVVVGGPVLPLPSGKGVAMRPWRHLATQTERDNAHAANLRAMMFHRPDVVDATAIAIQAINLPRDRMRQRRLVTTSLMADTLATLRLPVWSVHGEEDALYRDHGPQLDATLARLPGVTALPRLPQAGHWVQFEAAAATNRLLLDVLSR